jgi:hypothetical protein
MIKFGITLAIGKTATGLVPQIEPVVVWHFLLSQIHNGLDSLHPPANALKITAQFRLGNIDSGVH